MSRRIHDISRTIAPGALVYPGDPPLLCRSLCRIGAGSPFNMLELGWTTHFLTHIDAPLHFFEQGESVERIAPERFIGDALVIEARGAAVLPSDVPENAAGLNLLFKTENSARWDPRVYDREHVCISAAAAEAIAARGANLAGIDYLSVDRFGDDDFPAHRALLGAGVLVLEGLDLAAVPPGRYTLAALPLKIERGDGSPVRAVLWQPATR